MINYRVEVDVTRDQTWATSLTADLEAIQWRLGFTAAFESVAPAGEATITVRNWTQTYSPEIGSPLQIGEWLRIVVNDLVKFTGIIRSIAPMSGTQGERFGLISVHTPDAEFREVKTTIPLTVNTRAQMILELVMETWPLERFTRQLQTGVTVFEYVGDRWSDGITVEAIVQGLVEAERGRLFCDRKGWIQFLNRHHLLRSGAPIATITDAMSAAEYQYGADLITGVRVRVRPRSLGPSDATLWTLQATQTLRPGDHLFWARLRSSDGNFIGAVNVIPPVAGTDYSANSRSDGSGTDQTAALQVSLIQVRASAVRIRLRNTSSQVIYLLAGAKVRGTPLLLGDSVLIEHADEEAAGEYGARLREWDLPLLHSIELADQLARFELSLHQSLQGRMRSITFDPRSKVETRLTVQLFDRVSISESQTGHSLEYWVIGEQHRVDQRGHQLMWTLEPVVNLAYWQVGVTTLAQARLGY